MVGVGGHPEGHPIMSTADRWEVLEHKCRNIERRGCLRIDVVQVRSLHRQAVRHGGAGPLRGAPEHGTDACPWTGELTLLPFRGHCTVHGMDCAVPRSHRVLIAHTTPSASHMAPQSVGPRSMQVFGAARDLLCFCGPSAFSRAVHGGRRIRTAGAVRFLEPGFHCFACEARVCARIEPRNGRKWTAFWIMDAVVDRLHC